MTSFGRHGARKELVLEGTIWLPRRPEADKTVEQRVVRVDKDPDGDLVVWVLRRGQRKAKPTSVEALLNTHYREDEKPQPSAKGLKTRVENLEREVASLQRLFDQLRELRGRVSKPELRTS